MTPKVIVVGVGPGSPEYLTTRVVEILRSATVIAGFQHSLNTAKKFTQDKKVIPLSFKEQESILNKIRESLRDDELCVFTCTGDPMFSNSQFLDRIRRHFTIMEIVPGVSSIQVAASKCHLALDNTTIFTFHVAGEIEELKSRLLAVAKSGKHILLLPRPWDFMPNHIADFLISNDVTSNTRVTVYENLTLSDERVFKGTLKELVEKAFGDLSIMIIGV